MKAIVNVDIGDSRPLTRKISDDIRKNYSNVVSIMKVSDKDKFKITFEYKSLRRLYYSRGADDKI